MTKFKVGDRVKRIRNLYVFSEFWVDVNNNTYTVTEVLDLDYIKLNIDINKYGYTYQPKFKDYNFDLIDTFEIKTEEDYYTWLSRRNK